jgi:hypothetical protein
MEGGQYRCAFCGHRSLPPMAQIEQAERAAALAQILAGFEDRRARALGRSEELEKRARDAAASARDVNGWVMLGIGGLFLVFALVCFGGAVAVGISASMASTPAPATSHHHVHDPHPAADGSAVFGIVAGAGAFGLFWLALGGLLFYIGVRYRRAGVRERRMRREGLRGCAIVRSYKESNLVVDGNTKFDLVLEVEVPGRAPFLSRQSDYVPNPGVVTTGAKLAVFVDPKATSDVLVDWYTWL